MHMASKNNNIFERIIINDTFPILPIDVLQMIHKIIDWKPTSSYSEVEELCKEQMSYYQVGPMQMKRMCNYLWKYDCENRLYIPNFDVDGLKQWCVDLAQKNLNDCWNEFNSINCKFLYIKAEDSFIVPVQEFEDMQQREKSISQNSKLNKREAYFEIWKNKKHVPWLCTEEEFNAIENFLNV